MGRCLPYFESLDHLIFLFFYFFGAIDIEKDGAIRRYNEVYSILKVIDLGQNNEGNSNKC